MLEEDNVSNLPRWMAHILEQWQALEDRRKAKTSQEAEV